MSMAIFNSKLLVYQRVSWTSYDGFVFPHFLGGSLVRLAKISSRRDCEGRRKKISSTDPQWEWINYSNPLKIHENIHEL